MTDRSALTVAIHEAGHAVMSVHEHRPFRIVSIVADEHSLGRVLGTPVGDWFRPDVLADARTRRFVEREVAVFVAGPHAELRHRGSLDDEGWPAGSEHDLATAFDLASYMSGSDAEAEAYLAWLVERARNVLRNRAWWAAIEGLAADLVESKELSYRTARARILVHRAAALNDWANASGQLRPDNAWISRGAGGGLADIGPDA